MTLAVPGYRQVESDTCGFAAGLMVLHTFHPRADIDAFYRRVRPTRSRLLRLAPYGKPLKCAPETLRIFWVVTESCHWPFSALWNWRNSLIIRSSSGWDRTNDLLHITRSPLVFYEVARGLVFT